MLSVVLVMAPFTGVVAGLVLWMAEQARLHRRARARAVSVLGRMPASLHVGGLACRCRWCSTVGWWP